MKDRHFNTTINKKFVLRKFFLKYDVFFNIENILKRFISAENSDWRMKGWVFKRFNCQKHI